MKRMMTFSAALFLALGFAQAQSQVVDVCAGNDSVVLRLNNYGHGYVQWQFSDDNVEWLDIDGAVDTVYRFLPARPRYYRAEVKFPRCSEYNYHSQVTYVQMPPMAKAGPDLDVPANVPVRMCALPFDGAVGEWSIAEGSNGRFDDINDPRTMFVGEEGDYKLVWTLTNSCGSSSDTVNISCVTLEYNSKLLIVDETDIILSDTLQMLNGEYAVLFTDTVPSVTEGTVLLGYREKPFMRKVTAVEKVGDVFVMQTEQAVLADVILSGAMCFDPIGDSENADSTRVKVLERYPTRKEMAANPFLLRDGKVYFVKGSDVRDGSNVNVKIKDGKITSTLKLDLGLLHHSLNGLVFEFIEVMDPNFRAGINLRDEELVKFYMGFYGNKVSRTYKLSLDKQITATSLQLKGNINPNQIILGGFMLGVVPTIVTLDFPYSAMISASINGLELESTVEWTHTHAVEWRDGGFVEIDEKSEAVKKQPKPLNITGNLDAKISLGMKMGIMLADVLGPTVTLHGDFGPEFCFSITQPNTLTAKLAWGVDLDLGCRLQLFSNRIGANYEKNFSLYHDSEMAPKRLLHAGGDQQVYNPADFNFISSGGFLPEDIKVNVKGWFGSNMPLALVHFEPENGGEVSSETVIANAWGIASVKWKPGLSSGHARLKARVYDCDGKPIAGSPLVFHAYTQGTNDCWNTGLTAEFAEHVTSNGTKTIELVVNGGTEPYQYSTDGTTFSHLLQTIGFVPQVGHSYNYYIRDAHGCETEAYYSEPFYDCEASTLGLTVSVVNGNTINALARGGFEPYWYSIDGVNYESSFNSSFAYGFPNLVDGEYTVYAKDAFGCVRTKTVTIEREANVGLNIVGAGYDLAGNPIGTVQMLASVPAIYDRGICWAIKTNANVPPTVYDFRHSYGSGSDDYNFTLEGLQSGITYYVRAYVLTDAGTAYSNTVELTPQYAVTKPFVGPTAASSIRKSSARCSANVFNDGNAEVTDRGFCWSATNANPTLSDSHSSFGTGTGVFSGTINGLEPLTTYHVRAYATNGEGTAYGWVNQFTTKEGGAIPEDGLVAYYPFNGNANDESGNGNNGILSGSNVPVLTDDRYGISNNAYEFGGYYNYNWIRVPNSESLMFDKEMTMSFWIQQSEFAGMNGWMNYSTTDPGFAAICKAGDGNATYPGLYIMTGIGGNGEGIHVSTNNSNGNAHYQSNHNHNINFDKPDYQLGDWLHITLVVDNTDKILYLDGVEVARDELNREADFTSMNGQDLYIGIMAGGNMTYSWSFGAWYPFYGKIDDIRIYNRALDEEEINALYDE